MVKYVSFMLSVSMIFAFAGCFGSKTQDKSWVDLFDGKTLNGWHVLPGGSWQVEDGTIWGTSPVTEARHGILLSDRHYQDFVIRFKYQILQGNSGFYFRVDTVESDVSVNGFQAEIDAVADAGGLYETGGRQWVAKPDPTEVEKYFKPGQWNEMTVTAQGRNIKVAVNGYTTAELVDDPGRLEGYIGFQLHGGMEMNVRFKDIQIKML